MSDWIEWRGGECPAPNAIVELKFRDGSGSRGDLTGDAWDWSHEGLPHDIIAYRMLDLRENWHATGTSDVEPGK